MASFVGFGHSHVVALAKGWYALQAKGPSFLAPFVDGRFHYLHDPCFVPALSPGPEGASLNAAIIAKLGEKDPQGILLSIGGNEHNVLGLARFQQRYDFILSENPALALDPDAEIYPEATIRETLWEAMADGLFLLQAFRDATDKPIALIEPPPPLPLRQVLLHPQGIFDKSIDPGNLAPDCLRYKIWRVQAGLYRELCHKIGFIYIDTPLEMMDSNGMLVEAACGRDATHANELFGQTMIEKAIGLVSGAIAA
ncbi:hypothetical protein [Rhodoblastus sp.]|uniref:hypothetical protein n=1 Tax=Rhodoblastus sp. TaxID=1962975 RepID=UPI003F97BE8D